MGGQVLPQMGAVKIEHDVELAGSQIDVYVEMHMPDESLHRIAIKTKDLSARVGTRIVNGFAAITKQLRDEKLMDQVSSSPPTVSPCPPETRPRATQYGCL